MLVKKLATRAGLAVAASALALVGTAGSASANPNAPYIGSGYVTSGAGVWCVQHSINYFITHGYVQDFAPNGAPGHGTISEDSTWGPQTADAVRWIQGLWHFSQDAVVGPDTGTTLIWWGDPYYNGQPGALGYCWNYIPGDFTYRN